MKAKLIKKSDGWYNLYDGGIGIGSTNTELQGYKVSKRNCDEIFGVVDVEKLADELKAGISYKEYDHLIKRGIIVGFNKAMELNKDKVFTLEDMKFAWSQGEIGELSFSDIIQSLQQLTEIEVEIEMFTPAATYGHSGWHEEPKLDKNGCLILKKL
jgi:hypothetical protein